MSKDELKSCPVLEREIKSYEDIGSACDNCPNRIPPQAENASLRDVVESMKDEYRKVCKHKDNPQVGMCSECPEDECIVLTYYSWRVRNES